jgi:hypothetical protein
MVLRALPATLEIWSCKKVSKVGELFIFRKKKKPQPEVEKKEEDENEEEKNK